MTRGTVDPDIVVDVYDPSLAYDGTTLLPDNHNPDRPRIIEVNMLGEIIWQYVLPDDVKQFNNPGFDVERLANDDVLFLLPGKGIYEIGRSGKVVWSFIDPKVSHDADRLPDGNTLFVFGNNDRKTDAQVREIEPSGKVVWSWYARDYFDKAPYADINREGWSHTNAVTRLANSDILISLRNFNQVVEVDPDGQIVRTYGLGIFIDQHDPEMLPNGNLLVANHGQPQAAIEIDPKIRQVVWHSTGFKPEDTPVRDADRLPNGNTLITAATKLVEVTSDGKIVWQLKLKDVVFTPDNAPGLGFYTAERIGTLK